MDLLWQRRVLFSLDAVAQGSRLGGRRQESTDSQDDPGLDGTAPADRLHLSFPFGLSCVAACKTQPHVEKPAALELLFVRSYAMTCLRVGTIAENVAYRGQISLTKSSSSSSHKINRRMHPARPIHIALKIGESRDAITARLEIKRGHCTHKRPYILPWLSSSWLFPRGDMVLATDSLPSLIRAPASPSFCS